MEYGQKKRLCRHDATALPKPLARGCSRLVRCGCSRRSGDFVREVYVELSIGKSVPMMWRTQQLDYSLAVPRDSELVAVRVDVLLGETPQERAIWQQGGEFALRVPSRGLRTMLSPGTASEYVPLSLGEPESFVLELAGAEYAFRIMRAHIASTGSGIYPDPARGCPPAGTLAGLSLFDSMGQPANMAWFTPRVSLYFASIGETANGVRLVATPNDPDAELEWRLDGGKWDFLVSGLTSSPAAVHPTGWTILEVRVTSAASSQEPLIYQVAVSRGEIVCHPSCQSCRGPGAEDCEACFAPLVLHGSRCLYTSCGNVGYYFNASIKRCAKCHPKCVECSDGSEESCTVCPPSTYLLTTSDLAVVGSCETACPFGYFVQPTSQRCKRAPPTLGVERFYMRLTLRVSVDDFLEDADTLRTVLRVAAETLAVSPQDVRFHRWDSALSGLAVYYYLEVENPFLKRADAKDWITIDKWFAALPVPIDDVLVLSYGQLYPSPVMPKPAPLLEPWIWAMIGAGAASLILVYPLYLYFL
ncbi:unnamed protein product, partial [Polarella glacialis]